jgi:hypothetical protein
MANWIAKAVPKSHKGRLHRALHVPVGQKIPAAKMAQARKSRSPKVRAMARLADTLGGLK